MCGYQTPSRYPAFADAGSLSTLTNRLNSSGRLGLSSDVQGFAAHGANASTRSGFSLIEECEDI